MVVGDEHVGASATRHSAQAVAAARSSSGSPADPRTGTGSSRLVNSSYRRPPARTGVRAGLGPRAGLVVGVTGPRAEHQVAAGLRVAASQSRSRRRPAYSAADDQHRMRRAATAAGPSLERAAAGVDDAHLQPGVERAAVEGVEDAVGTLRRRSTVPSAGQRRLGCTAHLRRLE